MIGSIWVTRKCTISMSRPVGVLPSIAKLKKLQCISVNAHLIQCSHGKEHHQSTLNDRLRTIKTCPSLGSAIIEAIGIYCGVAINDLFVPAFPSSLTPQIWSAIHQQEALGVDNLLKGRVAKVLFVPQLEHFRRTHNGEKATPETKWKGWRKNDTKALVEYTLATWNDRNAVYHGVSLDQSHPELIAHVHQSITLENIVRTKHILKHSCQNTFRSQSKKYCWEPSSQCASGSKEQRPFRKFIEISVLYTSHVSWSD